ncbi:MAG TPA: RNA-binding protein [Rhizomicrobium sp.]|nr:RNA-binding protein [Rhizomicrobium sp.]
MLAAISENECALRERRCIATGAVLPEDKLVRFVVGPDGAVVADLDAKLPGRGLWLSADRAAIAKAVAKNDFSKAAKAKVAVPDDLAGHVERLIVARMQSDLGLARRAGLLAVGFDNVLRAFDAKLAPALLIEAADAAPDGRRKLDSALNMRGLRLGRIALLSRAELGLALGRENVVHAAVRPGALAERLKLNASRLAGLRPPKEQGSAQNESEV